MAESSSYQGGRPGEIHEISRTSDKNIDWKSHISEISEVEINAAGEPPTKETPTPSNEKPLSSSDQRRRLLVTSADSLRRGRMWFTVPETIVPGGMK